MTNILISGLINIETTLQIDSFPLEYFPVRYPFNGVNTTISGVGFNIAKALTKLGDQVSLLSIIGSDIHRHQIYQILSDARIDSRYVMEYDGDTPQSIVIFDSIGRRQIHVDLKGIQEIQYPDEVFDKTLSEGSLAVLCNINFSRNLLRRSKISGILVATDVHSISSINDEYNQAFMAEADILFCSDELLPCSPESLAENIFNRFKANIIVIGLGANGAYLAVKDKNIREKLPAIKTLPVVNTIGAGDALFSSFLHYYMKTGDALLSLSKAMLFASNKIGTNGASEGFLSEAELESMCKNYGIV